MPRTVVVHLLFIFKLRVKLELVTASVDQANVIPIEFMHRTFFIKNYRPNLPFSVFAYLTVRHYERSLRPTLVLYIFWKSFGFRKIGLT